MTMRCRRGRPREASLVEARRAYWLQGTFSRLHAVWPLLPSNDGELRRRVTELAGAASDAQDDGARAQVEGRLAGLFLRAQEKELEESSPEDVTEPLDDDGFVPMTLDPEALAWSRRELDTPEWAIAEGCRQVAFYNLARGRRDLKMLRGTRDDAGALWELRHRDGRHPVRVMYVYRDDGPRVMAVLAKQDDAHQGRMIERVRGALERARRP